MSSAQTQNFQARLQELGLGEGWEWKNSSWWLSPSVALDVRAVTLRMLRLGARFLCITAVEREDKEIRLDYQWDLDGQLLSFITATSAHKIPTIADISLAADWVERETHEYFAVEFLGRKQTPPLMTRPGDPVGINLRKEESK